MTTVGPHRDDLMLEIGGRRLREYGSTGQQRSAAIALKLLEIATLREARGTEPVLLLDDVFAELDRERQSRLALGCWGRRSGRSSSPARGRMSCRRIWICRSGRLRAGESCLDEEKDRSHIRSPTP